jgi:hypothetical protein
MASESSLPLAEDRTAPPHVAAETSTRARRLVGDQSAARAARVIFRRWLALRRRDVLLGPPLTDPLPGPYGSWYRVYRYGRIYWHPTAQIDVRLGVFVRVPVQSARGTVGTS